MHTPRTNPIEHDGTDGSRNAERLQEQALADSTACAKAEAARYAKLAAEAQRSN